MFVDDTGRAAVAAGDEPTPEHEHDCPLGFCNGVHIENDSQCAHDCQHAHPMTGAPQSCRFRTGLRDPDNERGVHELWEPECKQCRRTYRRRREAQFDASCR